MEVRAEDAIGTEVELRFGNRKGLRLGVWDTVSALTGSGANR